MFTDYMSIDFFFSFNNDSIDIYTSMVSHISDMWDIFQVKNKANEKMIAIYINTGYPLAYVLKQFLCRCIQ